jgi:nucleotide-binding universal stress UspA family protein
MNEPKVRRIAVACDAACDISMAVEEAAALAGRLNATLHGVFFEDENLYRLAALPFGRQMTLSPAVSESFSGADLEKLSSALGAGMRRALAEAAAQRGLEWSFGVVRDLPTVAAFAGIEADILVVEASTRPFSGSWRPRSALNVLAEAYERTILIRRETRTKPGTVVILLSERPDDQKILASGIVMANPEDDIAVLVRDGSQGDVDSVRRIAERLATPRRPVRTQAAPADMSALLEKIDPLKPVLIVLNGGNADGHAARALLAGTRCDVLLVR